MTAKEFLLQYQEAKKEVERMNESIEELRQMATSVSASSDGTHGSTGTDKIGNVISLIDEKERERAKKIRRAIEKMEEIESAINRIPNPSHRYLLEARYIRNMNYKDIAKAMHYDGERYIYKIHGHALNSLRDVLNQDSKRQSENCYNDIVES